MFLSRGKIKFTAFYICRGARRTKMIDAQPEFTYTKSQKRFAEKIKKGVLQKWLNAKSAETIIIYRLRL